MSLSAINEQLLRAVGVGVALFDAETLTLRFQNDVFSAWFEDAQLGQELSEIFPQLSLEEVRLGLAGAGRFATELRLRRKRRTLVIAQTIKIAAVGDERVMVLECQNISRIRELESMIDSYSAMVERNTREIQREKDQVEKLLLNIMPRSAYEEYKHFGIVAPQHYGSVSVLVLDFIGFSETMQQLAPATFVSELNELYGAFDRIGEQFGCERIKTTGDTYICVAGMHDGTTDHLGAVAGSAIRFLRYLGKRNDNASTAWQCRIGIAQGNVIGSVIGVQKYVYDVFGPAVDQAMALKSRAAAMEALVAAGTTEALGDGIALIEASRAEARDEGDKALAPEIA
ncbi:MAG: adenylate/guanylate cyclase domain-containing protein [Pseudomonadota bacterium]